MGRLTLLWVEGTGHGLPSPPGLFFLGGSVTVALVSTDDCMPAVPFGPALSRRRCFD